MHAAWVTPDCIPVHVHYWEIEEDIDRLACTGGSENFPLKRKAIRIEETEPATVSVILDVWKDVLKKDLVAISVENVNVGTLAYQATKVRHLVAVEIDQEVLFERRVDRKGVGLNASRGWCNLGCTRFVRRPHQVHRRLCTTDRS